MWRGGLELVWRILINERDRAGFACSGDLHSGSLIRLQDRDRGRAGASASLDAQ